MANEDQLWQTIRNPNGSWQNPFARVEDKVHGGPPGFAASGCAGVGDLLHVVGLGTDAQLYHTFRRPDGSWQDFFGLVEGAVGGGPQDGFFHVACGGIGEELHLVGNGQDGQLYHTIRHADGSWVNHFGRVEAEVHGGPGSFRELGAAGVGDSLHVVAVGGDELFHTIRHPDGSWQSAFGLVESQVHGGPQGFEHLACGGTADELHVVGLGEDDQLYHTVRHSSGSWQHSFGLIEGQVHGGPVGFKAVGAAGVGDVLEVVGVGSDGQLYHTIRHSNGSWQGTFGRVEGQVHGGPPSFTSVSCAGTGDTLQLVGSTWSGGWL